MNTESDPVPISALQHQVYCPRQAALIHLDQAWEDNLFTARGHRAHERVAEGGAESRGGSRTELAMPLWSERLGLVGVADAVELRADGAAYPVEYKHGPRRPGLHDDVQLCAQAMCLEEMLGRAVLEGAIWHISSRRRRKVAFTPALREAVLRALGEFRETRAAGRLPPPVNDRRCAGCSLRERCMPHVPMQRSAPSWLFEPLLDTA
jgi:CRISPR-associated exonuclease Cas4